MPVFPPSARKAFRKMDNGLRIAMRPLQIVGNFVFLSVAYFLGIGLSALLYRLGPGRRQDASGADSYWMETPPAPKGREAWLRPF